MKKELVTLLFLVFYLLTNAQSPGQQIDNLGNTIRSSELRSNIIEAFPEAGNPWVSVGPFGGDVVDLSIDPQNTDNIYAAAGLPFVSNDGGDSWVVLTALSSISSGNVNTIAALTDGTIFATGPYTFGKVFRSTNGGTAWHTRNIPVNSNGRCLATDPNDSSTIYVGLASNVSSTSNKVIVRSTDSGGTWTAFDMTSVLPVGWSVIDISVDPDDSQTLFAVANSGLSDAKIVASFDGGVTWEEKTSNLPTGVPYNAIAVAGQKVFLAGGQLFGSQHMGVYQSTDYGSSWANISSTFPNKVSNAILIDEADVNHVFIGTEGDGIYYSTDGGGTWNFDASGAGEAGAVRCLAMKPGSPDHLFAGFLSLALCKSIDAGLTWEYANNGIATLQVDDIEINPLDPEDVLAAFEAENSGGCYLSNDGGDTWELVTGLPGTRYSQVTFGSDGAMYTWSNGPSTVAQEGLYKSTDGGTSWVNTGPNIGTLFETQIFALAASQTNAELIFIGGNNFGVNGWESMIYRSENGGQTWVNTYIGSPDDNYSIRFLYIDPNSDDEILYAGYKSEVQGGFIKSTDGGFTWSEIGTTIPKTFKWGGAIVCRSDEPDHLLAGCGGYGNSGTIFRSSDGGVSWDESNLNLNTYSKINDILVHPANTDIYYCASSQNGVYISTDGGEVWAPAAEGLSATNITGLSNPFMHESAWNCFAATFTNSAYKTVLLDPAMHVNNDQSDFGITFYPNPSDGEFNVYMPEDKHVRKIEIVTPTGQIHSVKEDVQLTPGLLRIRVNLPAGVYLLRIYLKEETVSGKLVIQ